MSHSRFQVKIVTSESSTENAKLGSEAITKIFPTEIPKRFIDTILIQTEDGIIVEYTADIDETISINNIEALKEILEDFMKKDQMIETITIVLNLDKISNYLKNKSSAILDDHFTT